MDGGEKKEEYYDDNYLDQEPSDDAEDDDYYQEDDVEETTKKIDEDKEKEDAKSVDKEESDDVDADDDDDDDLDDDDEDEDDDDYSIVGDVEKAVDKKGDDDAVTTESPNSKALGRRLSWYFKYKKIWLRVVYSANSFPKKLHNFLKEARKNFLFIKNKRKRIFFYKLPFKYVPRNSHAKTTLQFYWRSRIPLIYRQVEKYLVWFITIICLKNPPAAMAKNPPTPGRRNPGDDYRSLSLS